MEKTEDDSLTKPMLKCISGEFDIESIHTLVLKEMDISDLGCLGECSGLERLNLSKNNINKLYSLAGLTNLVYLNLSQNRITSLEGLQALDNLVMLNLAGNLIGSVDPLRCLQGLEKFEDLRLKDSPNSLSNPVCMNLSYKTDVLNILPMLTALDGERLKGRGSGLYHLCSELDKTIAEREYKADGTVIPDGSAWIEDGFWSNKTAAQYESEGLNVESSEEQLKGLVSECYRLAQTADDKINSVMSSNSSAYITNPDS